MNDELFAHTAGTGPAQTDGQPPAADQRPAPPDRKCFVCDTNNWVWDAQAHHSVCSSNQALHADHLRDPRTWAGGIVPDAYQ